MISIKQLENQIKKKEGLKIKITAPKDIEALEYLYLRTSINNITINEFIERINNHVLGDCKITLIFDKKL